MLFMRDKEKYRFVGYLENHINGDKIKFRYLAKKELFKKKFAGGCMRQFGAVPVDRQNADPKAIKEIFRLNDYLESRSQIKMRLDTEDKVYAFKWCQAKIISNLFNFKRRRLCRSFNKTTV